ncbi:MAG: SPFH domain-containing protein [Allosphingosinicella sp.]|uniref:SPFH domain-containing protein n=1 Tax=Allosphingosinicella sp. TaxID=2823234 RepID=UPI00394C96B9
MNFLILLAIPGLVTAGAFLWRGRRVTTIYPPMVGLLYRNGRFREELPPGHYVHFDPLGRTRVVKVSLAELPAQIGEVSVLSKDRFSFRIGLAPVLTVTDARLYAESQAAVEGNPWSQFTPLASAHAALHPLLAAAATEAVGARTLADILSDQAAVAQEVRATLDQGIPGAAVERVLLTSLTLPPETRRMFTDVERARTEGLAALERARGEQAAMRVLANAARLVTDNPALGQLRLLQAIETSKGATTIVLGETAAALTGTGKPPSSPPAA